jgi:hypothetical protein
MKKEKNCVNCKFGLFGRCEGLKDNEEYQSIWENRELSTMERWIKAYEFKINFVCEEFKSLFIEYPIEVSKINIESFKKPNYKNSEVGKFVKVVPCAEEYNGQTYLGMYLGELPIGPHITHNSDTKELNISTTTNPAIFVFELNKIIYGMESFWTIIETEEDLKDITKDDIDNVWYVKLLKQLSTN